MLVKEDRTNNFFSKHKSKIILFLLIAVLVFFAYEYFVKYSNVLRNRDKLKDKITSYGHYSVLVFLLLQVIQVIAFFIPGEVIQIMGGYIYGSFYGTLLSIIGITIGSSIVYYLSNIIGKDFVNTQIKKNKLKFIEKALHNKKVNCIIFFMYLVPGIPKDILGYICGISNIKFKDYFIYSLLGRIPGIIMSSYFGAKLYTEDKRILIILIAIAIPLFILGVIKGEKIISSIGKND